MYRDKAYNNYDIEDLLGEAYQIHLRPLRKKNSKRVEPAYIEFVQQYQRKQIETVGSLVERLLPKHIHAVTQTCLRRVLDRQEGFELKLFLFFLAYSISALYHTT